MEATVVNEVMIVNDMKRRGQKEHSKQGGINKTNLYLNNIYNENI